MFEENKFKHEIITDLPHDATISLYRCGPMVDLCHGPHVPSTGLLRAAAVTNCSRAFWRGDVKREGLQRVYAITFPDAKQLKEYQTRIEEAKKRDHRVVGVHQELFFFHPLSPGSCFFLPLGARIYNNLIGYMREKYWEYEYEEVRKTAFKCHRGRKFSFGRLVEARPRAQTKPNKKPPLFPGKRRPLTQPPPPPHPSTNHQYQTTKPQT